MYPLKLSVKPGNWHAFASRRADSDFDPIKQKVFQRDQFTCQYCGFQALQYQEIVNVDENYNNNTMANMVTACVFCTQCFFLESLGGDSFGGGHLIYMTEMSQSELNSFCHVLFCAITNGTHYKETAQSIYRSIKNRSKIIEKHYGEGTSDPAVFGQLLIEYSANENVPIDNNIMNDFRLLPSRAKFRQQIERWAATALEELAEEES